MTRAPLRSVVGGFVTAALTVTTLTVAGAAPAHAATCATTTVLKVDNRNRATKTVQWGDRVSMWGEVDVSGCDDYVDAGSMILERSVNGGAWRTVAERDGTWVSESGSFVTKTARYRARYTGGTSEHSGHTFQPSVDVVMIKLIRGLVVTDKSTTRKSKGAFKIRPAASIRGMKVTFQRKKNGNWRFYKRLRANKRGKVTATFANSRKGERYRLILPGGRGMVKSVHGPFIATRR